MCNGMNCEGESERLENELPAPNAYSVLSRATRRNTSLRFSLRAQKSFSDNCYNPTARLICSANPGALGHSCAQIIWECGQTWPLPHAKCNPASPDSASFLGAQVCWGKG